MNNDERFDVVPDDYRLKKQLEYLPVEFEHAAGIEMLDDAQAGQVIKRLLAYAADYAVSFDDGLEVDVDGLEPAAAFMLKLASGSAKRRFEKARRTAYNRSGAKGGGRPSNK